MRGDIIILTARFLGVLVERAGGTVEISAEELARFAGVERVVFYEARHNDSGYVLRVMDQGDARLLEQRAAADLRRKH